MVADGNNDCELDEKTLVHNCSDPSLFLCLDKSRCLPNKFKCDGVQSCIDASDEIEQCEYPTMFRIYKFDNGEKVSVDHWLHLLQLDKKLQSIEPFESKEIFSKGRQLARERLFGIKCEVRNYDRSFYTSVPQPTHSSSKSFCLNYEDRCFNEFGELNCFKCFSGTIILYSQVCDGIIDCQDLSDECTCEESEVENLCKLIYTDK